MNILVISNGFFGTWVAYKVWEFFEFVKVSRRIGNKRRKSLYLGWNREVKITDEDIVKCFNLCTSISLLDKFSKICYNNGKFPLYFMPKKR